MKDKVVHLHSAQNRNRGKVSVILRQEEVDPDESVDGDYRLINYGLNDCFTQEELINFAEGILELTGKIKTKVF